MNVLISITLFFLFYVCIKRTKYDKTFLMGIYLSKILNNKILCLFNKIVQNILVYRYNSVIPLKILKTVTLTQNLLDLLLFLIDLTK